MKGSTTLVVVDETSQDSLVSRIQAAIADVLAESRHRPPQLVDGDELARLLSVSSQTVARMRQAGSIPFVEMGRLIRYSPDAVVAALATDKKGAAKR
ncbi:helix-turn-helix domain-containing protein [Rhodopirellula europaea]|uniref:helix-turn-helix domain-containing protein n=1 Tax=Rhodopirellula europaea TaxID=1263866 RepID=UPI003D2BEB68